MLIYYANIPEETLWFEHRVDGGYIYLFIILLLGRFLVPFVLLLSKNNKTNKSILLFVSIWILVIHAIELYWIVMPTHNHHLHFSILDITTLIGLATLFLALFFQRYKSSCMIPKNDPFLADSLNQH